MKIHKKKSEYNAENYFVPHNIVDSNNDLNLCSVLIDGEDVLFDRNVENFQQKLRLIIDEYKNKVNNFYVITYGEPYSDINGTKLETIVKLFTSLGMYDRFFVRTSSNKNTFRCNFQTSIFWLRYNEGEIVNPSSENIQNHFLSMCRRVSYHRQYIFDFLKDNNLLDKSSYSFASGDVTNPHHKSLEGYELSWDRSNEQTKLLNEYNTCFVNLNTESLFEGDINLITEKTNKCITTAQPFIMISTPHTLRYLKELGFKTFDKWWDESYDDEVNDNVRLDKISKVISNIATKTLDECKSMYDEMIPILIHNQNNLKRIQAEKIDSTFYLHNTHYFNNTKTALI